MGLRPSRLHERAFVGLEPDSVNAGRYGNADGKTSQLAAGFDLCRSGSILSDSRRLAREKCARARRTARRAGLESKNSR